jgi:hypothetical protein
MDMPKKCIIHQPAFKKLIFLEKLSFSISMSRSFCRKPKIFAAYSNTITSGLNVNLKDVQYFHRRGAKIAGGFVYLPVVEGTASKNVLRKAEK